MNIEIETTTTLIEWVHLIIVMAMEMHGEMNGEMNRGLIGETNEELIEGLIGETNEELTGELTGETNVVAVFLVVAVVQQ